MGLSGSDEYMAMSQDELEALATRVGEALQARAWRLAAAESCTGGWAAQAITAIAGSSLWFDRGFVTYSNAAKCDVLGVTAEILTEFGAVSEACARGMADGARRRSLAQVAFAITGIAGPAGGSPDKPVGTVCFAWSIAGRDTETARMRFDGDRRAVRAQSVAYVFRGILERLAAMQ
jgi:nicotinamide-nucleotide amidase